MIDFVGFLGIVLAQRVVGQLRQMNYRVEALQIGGGEGANVAGERRRTIPAVMVKQAGPVEARIEPHDVEPSLDEQGGQDRTDKSVGAGYQNANRLAVGCRVLIARRPLQRHQFFH